MRLKQCSKGEGGFGMPSKENNVVEVCTQCYERPVRKQRLAR